jgi:DNA-binding Xre family transcriptional regulator
MGFIHCNLRVLMAERGLNIQQVKDKTSLSRTTISNLYNNYGAGVQYDTMVQLCKLFNCQPGDIFKFIDISVEFEEEISIGQQVKIQTDFHVTDPNKDEGIKFISELKKLLMVHCKLVYEGEVTEFDFNVNTKAQLDRDMNIRHIENLQSDVYLNIINNVNYPYYVEEYIDNKFNEFMCEWVHNYVEKESENL